MLIIGNGRKDRQDEYLKGLLHYPYKATSLYGLSFFFQCDKVTKDHT